MGLPKKAKGGSKHASQGGKSKDGKPKQPMKPHVTVRNALQAVDCAECLYSTCVDETRSDIYSQQPGAVTVLCHAAAQPHARLHALHLQRSVFQLSCRRPAGHKCLCVLQHDA